MRGPDAESHTGQEAPVQGLPRVPTARACLGGLSGARLLASVQSCGTPGVRRPCRAPRRRIPRGPTQAPPGTRAPR